jgi:hypothetical protein
MPDPAHTVTRSTRLLRGLGYSQAEALETIATVCLAARHVLDPDGEQSPGWIDAIEREAEARLRGIPVPHSETGGNDNEHRHQ